MKTTNKNGFIKIGIFTTVLILMVAAIFVTVHNYNKLENIIFSVDVADDGQTEETEERSGNIQLEATDDGFVCKNPVIPINGTNGDVITVKLPDGEYLLAYDKNESYLEIKLETTSVFVRSGDSAEGKKIDNSVYQFEDDEGVFVVGAKTVGSTDVTIFCQTVKEDGEHMCGFIEQIVDELGMWDGTAEISVCGMTVNPEWEWDSIQVTDEFLNLENDGELVNVSFYDMSITDAGMSNKVDVPGVGVFSYGDYQDSETGLRPFVLEGDISLKVVAPSTDCLQDVFAVN